MRQDFPSINLPRGGTVADEVGMGTRGLRVLTGIRIPADMIVMASRSGIRHFGASVRRF